MSSKKVAVCFRLASPLPENASIFRITYPFKIVTTLRCFAGDKPVSSSKGKGQQKNTLAKYKHLFLWSYLPNLVRSETITLFNYSTIHISFCDGIAIVRTSILNIPLKAKVRNRVTATQRKNFF